MHLTNRGSRYLPVASSFVTPTSCEQRCSPYQSHAHCTGAYSRIRPQRLYYVPRHAAVALMYGALDLYELEILNIHQHALMVSTSSTSSATL